MTKSELLQIAKPILFNGDMVGAILENRKGATRRAVKKFIPDDAIWGYTVFTPKGCISCRGTFADGYGEKFFRMPCQPGDILYVRETWAVRTAHRFDASANIMFKAGGRETILTFPNGGSDSIDRIVYDNFLRKWDKEGRWNPSIHMPKEATRIFLKVTDVKVQRLHDMTLDNFLAEGVTLRPEAFNDSENAYLQAQYIFAEEIWDKTLKKAERELYSWDANPWVWAIEFDRIYPDDMEG